MLLLSDEVMSSQRIIFGERKIKNLLVVIHWVKDFRKCNLRPSLDCASFLVDLDIAVRREEIRKVQIENSESVMKEVSLRLSMSETKSYEWEPAFENYLSSGFGVDGVSLSYVIRKDEIPDFDAVSSNFTEKIVACAPL